MHDQEQFVDEDTYFAVREEQLVRKLERSGYGRQVATGHHEYPSRGRAGHVIDPGLAAHAGCACRAG
jgi:hypothetical protein